GAIGFFGYDLLQYYEKRLPPHRQDDLQMDDMHFMFCDKVIVFDHFKQQVLVIGNVHVPESAADRDIESAYRTAVEGIHETIRRLEQPVPQTPFREAPPQDP